MKSYLLIIRPFNCLFVGLAVLTGALLGQMEMLNNYLTEILMVIASAGFIAAGGYVINDYYDLPIDTINKPRRILPSGRLHPEKAYILAMALFVIGIIISIIVAKMEIIVIALLNSLLLYFYAKKIKRYPLIGNIIVAWTTASTFLYGALITNNLQIILPLFFYTALYTLTREIIKDAEDVVGDNVYGAKTIAACVGEKCAVIISVIPVLLLLLMLYYDFRLGVITEKIFYPILVVFVVPLVIIYPLVIRDIANKNLNKAAMLFKIHMLILLIAYILLN